MSKSNFDVERAVFRLQSLKAVLRDFELARGDAAHFEGPASLEARDERIARQRQLVKDALADLQQARQR